MRQSVYLLFITMRISHPEGRMECHGLHFVWIHSLFAPGPIRSLERIGIGPWPIRCLALSLPGPLAPWNFRSQELFAPRNVRSLELSFPVMSMTMMTLIHGHIRHDCTPCYAYSDDILVLTRNCAIKRCHMWYKCCYNKR